LLTFEVVAEKEAAAIKAAEWVGFVRVAVLGGRARDMDGHPRDLVLLEMPPGNGLSGGTKAFYYCGERSRRFFQHQGNEKIVSTQQGLWVVKITVMHPTKGFKEFMGMYNRILVPDVEIAIGTGTDVVN
jgi:hypothetical protein